jgi:membrane-associated phospholipid phosphatase
MLSIRHLTLLTALCLALLPAHALPEVAGTPAKHTTAPAVLLTAGLLLIPLDRTLDDALPRTDANTRSDALTEGINSLGTVPVLLAVTGGLYATGYLRHDAALTGDAKLGATALVVSAALTETTKRLVGRVRPDSGPDSGDFTGPGWKDNTFQSFPSGHTAGAFALATVLADRHPRQKWLYYTLATGVAFARVRKSAHYPSDVLAGAGLGIYAGQTVLGNDGTVLGVRF